MCKFQHNMGHTHPGCLLQIMLMVMPLQSATRAVSNSKDNSTNNSRDNNSSSFRDSSNNNINRDNKINNFNRVSSNNNRIYSSNKGSMASRDKHNSTKVTLSSSSNQGVIIRLPMEGSVMKVPMTQVT